MLMMPYRGFMPPEYIGYHLMTPKNDVFSLGVTIFHMMVGEKGYTEYCDMRARQELSEKGQRFIEGVRKFSLYCFCSQIFVPVAFAFYVYTLYIAV